MSERRLPVGFDASGKILFDEAPTVEVLYEWPDGLFPNVLRPCRIVQHGGDGGWPEFQFFNEPFHEDAGWHPLGAPDDSGLLDELAADLARKLREANAALLGMQT